MRISLENKFTEKHIDIFISSVYNNIKKKPNDSYLFDLSQTEWISNQNLLLFSALLKYLYNNNITFKVQFKKIGVPTSELTDRTKLQIVQLWEIWEIYSTVSTKDYSSFFDVNQNTIKDFKSELISKRKYNEKSKEIYNRFGITPLIVLNKINNYKDNDLLEYEINPIYQLNKVVEEQLQLNGCYHPFLNNTLSAIITKELYENFLDHSNRTLFKNDNDWAFMSLALSLKQKQENQSLLQVNFEEEEIPETLSFFKEDNKFKNQSLIQFSFLDFGEGIPTSLREQYIKENGVIFDNLFQNVKDYEILKYAFKHNSSRNPILDFNDEKNVFIPRGLFDLLTIVKRYKGLLIARSNYGKILYNFSDTENFDDAFTTFGNDSHFFPGTFISIYLPSLINEAEFDKSVIKPSYSFKTDTVEKINNINIYTLEKKISLQKEYIYNDLIKLLSTELLKTSEINTLNYISFLGCKDERIIKKTVFFLLTDYNINVNNSIIVLHPPDKELLASINDEVLSLNKVIKDFKIHPIPFIYLNDIQDDVEIVWVGIYEEEDKQKLNQFLFDEILLPKTDFIDIDSVYGNLHFSDKHGNLNSKIPKSEKLLQYYLRYQKIDDILIENLVIESGCIKENGLYLCNGNYYQDKFLQLIDLLNSKSDCDEITKLLYQKIGENTSLELSDINYIAITSSSHKILNSLIRQELIHESQCLYFDSYISFERDAKLLQIKSDSNYILVCDAISTGNLTKRIETIIKKNNSNLHKIAVIANTLDVDFEFTNEFISEFESRIIHLFKFPIKKFRRSEIVDKNLFKEVIRINPYTNIPITFSENLTLKDTILLDSSHFIDYLENDDININFKIFNNLIHPYFFNLRNILASENNKIENNIPSLLDNIFNNLLKDKIEINDKLKIFYPKESDIKTLKFERFISKVLKNQSIDVYELERFNTDEGWKFPHTTDFYSSIVEDNNVLIFDDGSCTGDSLLQMINELTIFKPKKIDLLCLVGRVDDHKREFFSKINSLKYNLNLTHTDTSDYGRTSLNIYFASHWHISTFYLDNSPYTEEIYWLKDLLRIRNIPMSIKSIANAILMEISPKKENYSDYKYFPRNRDNRHIPKKDLIIVRNEIGKIIGYRFYKEDFKWFNSFIAKYESRDRTSDRTKDIELLAMALLYEPYLYEKISNILPDVREKLELFIDSIIFGNPENKNKKIDIQKHLYFDWSKNKKDIIHLFFIIYKRESLIGKLNNKTFADLLDFSKDAFKKINSINYLFYKFLGLFPLTNSELGIKNNNIILLKEFFYEIIENQSIDVKSLAELKRFYSFINTLPSGEDLKSQIDKIKNIYWENEQPKLHDNRESFNHNISKIIANLKELKDLCNEGTKLDENKIFKIKESWWNIKQTFLDPLISFYRSFEDFFKPYPYHLMLGKLESKNNSLIEMYSFLDDFIFNLAQKGNDIKNYDKSLEYIEIIQNHFGLDSEFRNIFENPSMNYSKFIDNFKNEFNKLENKISLDIEDISDFDINIPAVYLNKLIIDELKNNLLFYSDKKREIFISVKKNTIQGLIDDHVCITLINSYSENVKEFSSSEGLNSLNIMTVGNVFNFSYDYSVDKDVKSFTQKLIFML